MTNYLLITGASSGIGQQCAIQLSQEYNLVLSGRSVEKLGHTLSLCNNKQRHVILELDLSDIPEISHKLSDCIVKNNIIIDRFLHCAGDIYTTQIKLFDYHIIKQIFDINLFSSMEIIKLLLKKSPNQKGLVNIIFISALYSKKAVKGNSFYASSKAALDSYMRCLAKELAPQVRANSILPGGIRTPMSESVFSDEQNLKKILADYPLGFGKKEDVANIVEFLFSDKSKWITGQQISVDGGASI